MVQRLPPPPDLCVPESHILKSLEKTVDSDEWPTFVLTDAVVYRQDGTTMANGIFVDRDGPFIVRGLLEVDDDDDVQYLVRPDVRSAYIQIDNSSSYSLGVDSLPSAIIWVSGDAGWFEITPHAYYVPIYNEMCAISLFYHRLVEIYENATRRVAKSDRGHVFKTLDVKTILFEYAVTLGDGSTYDEIVDTCLRLGPALLAHFSVVQDLKWAATSFYRWLEKELTNRDRTHRLSGRATSVSDSHSQPSSIASHTSPATTPAAQQLPFRAPPKQLASSTPQKIAAASVQMPMPFSPSTAPHKPPLSSPELPTLLLPPAVSPGAAAPLDDFKELRQRTFESFLAAVRGCGQHADRSVSLLDPTLVHNIVYSNYRLRNHSIAKTLSAVFRAELVPALGPNWRRSAYVRWLQSGKAHALEPPNIQTFLESTLPQLVRRSATSTKPLRTARQDSSGADARKSVARTMEGGKRPGLRLPTTSKKRRFDGAFGTHGSHEVASEYDDTASSVDGKGDMDRPRKTARHDGATETVSIPDSMSDSSIENGSDDDGIDDSDDGDDEDDEDQAWDEDKPETMLVLHAESLVQSTRPTGPDHTWTCEEPGCFFFVRHAEPLSDVDEDEDEGEGEVEVEDEDEDEDDDGHKEKRPRSARNAQARIVAHLRSHEAQTLNRVDLAIVEGSRRRVSVDHLLAKIRSLAETKQRESAALGVDATGSIAPPG